MTEQTNEAIVTELIGKARDRSSWETRLAALKQLEQYDTPKVRETIIGLALRDRVYAVKEEAVNMANRLNYTKDGQKIVLTKKNTGYKNSDFTKVFHQVKRDLELGDFEFEVGSFKEQFKEVNPEMYDVMQYEHKDGFDQWIENKYMNLPKK